MSLPDSRDQTFAPLSQVPSDTLNDLQDEVIYNFKRNNRCTIIADHFTGENISSDIWRTPSFTGTGAGTMTDDTANGGNGTYKLDSGTGSFELFTRPLALGTDDFRLLVRLRLTLATAGDVVSIRIGDTSPNIGFYANFDSSPTNWRKIINDASGNANNPIAFGTSTYQWIELRRRSNVATWYVNDVELHSVAYTSDLTGKRLLLIGDLGGVAWVDYVELEVGS
jgi:hypothetical protein